MNSQYNIIIGIDQTGAVAKNGLPKPLDVSLFDLTPETPVLHTQLKINKICESEITDLIHKKIMHKNFKVLIAVDAVLGLPKVCNTTFEELLTKASIENENNISYGNKSAFNFYNQFLDDRNTLPKRKVETLVGANSVFNMMPYQRNIGCGSYRILREMSEDTNWYNVWPFVVDNQKAFTITECYPTFFWKSYFKMKVRDRNMLQAFLNEQNNIKVKFESEPLDANQADATVISLGAKKILDDASLLMAPLISNEDLLREGWILGA